MRVVVDTNIVFSALINASGSIGDILLNIQDDLQFFAPELLKVELVRYNEKLLKASKLSQQQLIEISHKVFERIMFVSEDLISESAWMAAYELTKDVDEDDMPFVALSFQLAGKLWSGDKKLCKGLTSKGCDVIIETQQLLKYLSH